MPCEHLRELEAAIADAAIAEESRGKAWSNATVEWVYFACWLDLAAIRRRFRLDACIAEHSHRGTHDGAESGLRCTACQTAIMGWHADVRGKTPRFP